MIRLGLCCIFRDEPIKFRTTTVTAMARNSVRERRARLAELCAANAESLMEAFTYCAEHGIGCFRVLSQILPLKTHPEFGYDLRELPGGDAIVERFQACGAFALEHGLRASFHPDQFVVLNSPRADVVESSVRELEYQAEVAEWVGADVVNIHGGGAYGDKAAALKRFARNLGRLSDRVRERLTVENDDKVYAPEELLPVCTAENVPLVYDAHHHRCCSDDLSIQAATDAARTTWNREPMFHISSPAAGWKGPAPHRHHDFINVSDFPREWFGLDITVEVEAKAKEAAVQRLQRALARKGVPIDGAA